MKKNNKSSFITGLIMLALSLVLFLGILTVFSPCGPKEDGSFMACHWMGQSVVGISAAMTVISVLRLLVPKDIGLGLSISMIPVSAAAAALPLFLMGSCMMETMKCNALTKPAAASLAVVILIVAVVDVLVLAADRKKQLKKENKGAEK